MIIPVWILVDFVRSKVGCGYVWGASGEFCSPSLRSTLAKRAPSQKGNILGICEKWDGMQVFDCATLIREAFEAAGIKRGSGATTIWRTWPFAERGTIDTLPPNEPGIALFRAQAGVDKMGHIGMTIGGGLAVDARGSSNGVLLGPVSSVKWTHWARFEGVDYRAVQPDLPAMLGAVVISKGKLNLRARPDTNSQVLAKLPSGEVLAVYKDGQTLADWLKVYYAGGVAYVMKKYVYVGAALPAEPPAGEPADPPKEPPTAPLELRTLRYTPGLPFMRGEDVKLVQARLVALGYKPGVADGVYGARTKAAVLALQLDAFPSQPKEWDGIVGTKTWGKLK